MWGEKSKNTKNEATKTNPQQTSEPSQPQLNEKPKLSKSATNPVSTIGTSLNIHGDFSCAEDVIILGKVKGTIKIKNNKLTIGRSGEVEADIIAKMIRIEGRVIGDIYAHKAIILKTGDVLGNLNSPSVILEDGAQFKGSIDMDTRPVEEKLGKVQVALIPHHDKQFHKKEVIKKIKEK